MKRKDLLTVFLTVGLFFTLFSQPAFRFQDLDRGIFAQNDTDSGIETEGTTPRIKSKKKYEYKEGKSPMIAAGLSLLLPGAGEFYGKDYLRSGIFFGVEAIMLSMWYYYESDGDDKKDAYREYADTNFDEDLYYGGLLGMTRNFVNYLENQTSRYSASDIWNYDYFSDRDNWTHDVNDSLSIVKMLEYSYKEPWNGGVVSLEGGSAQFTHNLPATKTQQYYEMAGKYHQFSCGWNDFTGYEYENGQVAMDSVYVKNSTGENVLVMIPKFETGIFDYGEDGYDSESHVDFYEDLRNETNKAYEMGQNFLMITLVNHVASAFDASYVIKSKYQIDTQLRIENNDKTDTIGLENYKVTYSFIW